MQPDRKTALLLALGIDKIFGDPPNRYHPVAWMGTLISSLKDSAPQRGTQLQFWYGASLTLAGAALSAGAGKLIGMLGAHLPAPARWIVEALALKSTFSLRGLDRAAGDVSTALEQNNLPQARRLVSWHLVSRDTSELDQSQVAAATIESVAENASDGVIAPLFFYALGGLPAALAYRFINTADAMLGYRDAAREWLGKFPAKLDDALNFIPARLTGILLVAAAKLTGREAPRAWRVMRRDAATTDSPNAGYPMSAMAGALNVKLEKVGQYTLGRGQHRPRTEDIEKARGLLAVATGLAVATFIFFTAKNSD